MYEIKKKIMYYNTKPLLSLCREESNTAMSLEFCNVFNEYVAYLSATSK